MLKKYYSGYIDLDCKSDYSEQHYKGRFFSVYFDTPRERRRNSFAIESDSEGNIVEMQCKEAIIQTSNIYNAIKASELINAALNLVRGSVFLSNELPSILPLSTIEKKLMLEIPESEIRDDRTIAIGGVSEACRVACRASFRKAYYNALLKYQLGNYLCPISMIDINPFHSPYYKISPFLFDHFRFAYAIIAFYSVVEELGFEIKASKEMPSFIKGQWNPVIKKDVEDRLIKAGFDPKDLFVWNLRSTPTTIERHLRKKGKLRPIKKTSWARANVRDTEIELVDAIALVSNLRSSISSHKFNKSVESLSVYDVSNANYLARRLLLGAIGLWKPKGK